MIEKLKQLAADTVIYGLSIFLGRFLTFLLTFFYTNYLTMEEFGIISVFFTAFAFLNIFYSFGFDSGYFRFASDKSSESERKSVFTMTFLTIAIIATISTSLIILFRHQIAGLIPEIENGATWVLIASFIPLIDSLMFVPFSRLRLLRKSMRFGLMRLGIVLLTVSLNVYILTETNLGGLGVLIAGVISPLLIGLTFIPDIVKSLTKNVDWKVWKSILLYSAPTLPASLAVIALQFVDQPMLKAFIGAEAVALYNANYKLALPMMMFVSMFEYAWKPFYLNNFRESNSADMFKTVMNYYVAFCGLIFLVVTGFIPYIVKMEIGGENIYNPSYWSGIYIIPIIMGGYFFNGLFNQFSMGVNITKTTKYLPIAVVSAAVLNFIGNYFLIPIYGFEASAWLTLACYGVSASIIYYFSQKVYPLKYEWKKIIVVVVSVLAIYSGSLMLDPYFDGKLKAMPDLIAVLAFPIALYFLGFFDKRELAYIRRVISRK